MGLRIIAAAIFALVCFAAYSPAKAQYWEGGLRRCDARLRWPRISLQRGSQTGLRPKRALRLPDAPPMRLGAGTIKAGMIRNKLGDADLS